MYIDGLIHEIGDEPDLTGGSGGWDDPHRIPSDKPRGTKRRARWALWASQPRWWLRKPTPWPNLTTGRTGRTRKKKHRTLSTLKDTWVRGLKIAIFYPTQNPLVIVILNSIQEARAKSETPSKLISEQSASKARDFWCSIGKSSNIIIKYTQNHHININHLSLVDFSMAIGNLIIGRLVNLWLDLLAHHLWYVCGCEICLWWTSAQVHPNTFCGNWELEENWTFGQSQSWHTQTGKNWSRQGFVYNSPMITHLLV